MKIVILNGSPRSGGNTELMAKAFADAASPRHQVEILNIARMNMSRLRRMLFKRRQMRPAG